jgi:hypothetical protein
MLEVRVQAHRAERLLGALAGQLPFATSKAINETAKDFQKVQRRHMLEAFVVRRRTFVERSVKIKPFANKRRLEATVSIDPPGGKARADILAKFERTGRKRPRSGKHVAVPIAVRRGKTGVISRRQRPKAFGFRTHRTRTGRLQLKGQRRTFILRGSHTPGIYQRVGRGRGSRIRLLYTFKRSVPIDARLRFIENARRTINKRFVPNFRAALQHAIRTARR